MNRKKLIFFVGLGVVLVTASLTSWWYYSRILAPRLEITKWEERAKASLIFKRATDNIDKLWFRGDQEGKWGQSDLNCPKLIGEPGEVSDVFLRCNPSFLECYFSKGKTLKIDYGKEKFNVILSPDFKTITGETRLYQISNRSMSNHPLSFFSGVKIRLAIKEIPDYTQDVFLEDSCHEAFLPQRKYGHGEYNKNKEDYLWDSIGRLIIFDRYLVTERDARDWADSVKLPKALDAKIRGKIEKRAPYLPIASLTKKEMDDFCRFKGKTLMSSLVFDAASFFPVRLNDPLPYVITRGPYPWGYREKDSFVYKFNQGDLSQITKENCQLLFAQDCKNVAAWKAYSRDSASFAGLFQILGGFMEYMDNPLNSYQNLKVSSVYFPLRSSWHRLGKRAFWDGQDHTRENFKTVETVNGKTREELLDLPFEVEKFEVAFRCMREMQEETP